MRGKRLTVDEVKALPLGTKVVVFRGEGWNMFTGESIETVEMDKQREDIVTVDDDGEMGAVGYVSQFKLKTPQTEYYEYMEGSTTNEETI